MQFTHLYCSLQNRLGALDRILMEFTHRGIIPTQLFSSHNEENKSLELAITFEAIDERNLQKLIKSLQKQIYVLDVRRATFDSKAIDENKIASKPYASKSDVAIETANIQAMHSVQPISTTSKIAAAVSA